MNENAMGSERYKEPQPCHRNGSASGCLKYLRKTMKYILSVWYLGMDVSD